jgi:hypothetical protein
MFTVELYARIRRAVMVDGLSRREAASLDTGLHEPDGFREKQACRGKKARRMIKAG